MHKLIAIILFAFTTSTCCGQTHRIIFGDTTFSKYYFTSTRLGLSYHLNHILPDGHWIAFNKGDTVKPIREVNYKNGQKNGFEIIYVYVEVTKDSIRLRDKWESLFFNGIKIKEIQTSYFKDGGYRIHYSSSDVVTNYLQFKLPQCPENDYNELNLDSTLALLNGIIIEKCSYSCKDTSNCTFWTVEGKIKKQELRLGYVLLEENIYENGLLKETKVYVNGELFETKKH